MRVGKSPGYLHNLTRALVGTEIDGSADGSGTHIGRLLYRAEHDLVELVRKGQELVVIDFHEKWNLVGIFTSHSTQNPKGGSKRIAAAFDSQAYNIFGVEIIRVFGKTRAGGMFDSLVHRKNGKVTCAA